MSLWLALLWFACCALGFAVFILCRKRMADISHDVGEEIDHRIRRILKAAREAEDQLCDAFLHFQNQADAIQVFQKARAQPNLELQLLRGQASKTVSFKLAAGE